MALDKDKLDALRIERGDDDLQAGGAGKWWLAGVALIVLLALLAWFWRGGEHAAVATVAVQAPATGSSATVLNASGYVVARRIATVSSKVTGKIIDVRVEEGALVKEGDILARLDDSTVKARLALAESQEKAAGNMLQEIVVRLDEARRTLRRTQSLREQNLVSTSALEAAQADVSALEARLRSARGDIDVAGRNVELARQDLDDLVIRAPFSGVIISKNAQPGEMISPMSAGGGFTRTGICTIVDMDSREIEVDVNEAYINRVYPEQPVEAVLDAYPDWKIAARVINIVPTADRNRATVKVRLGFNALDPRILPDMGVKVRFLEPEAEVSAAEARAVGLIPVGSVFNENDRDYVWVVRNEQLEKRAIRLGRRLDDRYEVVAGLSPGQVLVAAPAADLTDGATVRTSQGE